MNRARMTSELDAIGNAIGMQLESSHDCFVFNEGYHTRFRSINKARDDFENLAFPFCEMLARSIPIMVDEFFERVSSSDNSVLGALRDNGWILGISNALIAEIRITSAPSDFVVVSPGLSVVRNLGSEPLPISLIPLCGPSEGNEGLDIGLTERHEIAPGEQLFIDSFRHASIFEQPGGICLVLSTVAAGAYESVFRLDDGVKTGMFSSDLRVSAIDVAMKVFTQAGWIGAKSLIDALSLHSLRELRWSALNFAWVMDLPELPILADRLSQDSNPEIRSIARYARSQLSA